MSMLLPFFAQRAADQLITRQALVSEASIWGSRVTPQEVQDDLQHGAMPPHFPRWKFHRQAGIRRHASRRQPDTHDLEGEVRKELLLEKLRAAHLGSASVSDDEIRKQFVKENAR